MAGIKYIVILDRIAPFWGCGYAETVHVLLFKNAVSVAQEGYFWCFSSTFMSVGFGSCVLEDMNAATTSFSPSCRINAGLSFVAVRSVNGKGIRTILPFNWS